MRIIRPITELLCQLIIALLCGMTIWGFAFTLQRMNEFETVKKGAERIALAYDEGIYESAVATSQVGDDLLNISIPKVDFSKIVDISTICDDAIEALAEESMLQQKISRVRSEMASRPGMLGRLIVPGAQLDVAFFNAQIQTYSNSARQAVTDAPDSCAYIPDFIPGTVVLADHNHQEFGRLLLISPGMTGYIVTDSEIINLVANHIFNGHNTEVSLTDAAGNPLVAFSDYMAYTCLDRWQNIRIVGFDIY